MYSVVGQHVSGTVCYGVLFFLFIAAIAVTGAAFGQGTGPVYLNSVGCTGTESSLLSCSHSVIGVSCSHSSDAGVVCPSGKLVKLVAKCDIITCHCLFVISTTKISKQKLALVTSKVRKLSQVYTL